MKKPATPITWPKLLSPADYARACAHVTGRSCTRQAIDARLRAGSLTATSPVPGSRTRYIDTEQYPPGDAPGPYARAKHRKPATS